MAAARAEDPETAGMRELFDAWNKAIGLEKSVSAGEIVGFADQKSDEAARFREVLVRVAGDGHGISSVRLGQWLGRRKDRIANGLRVVGAVDPHLKILMWKLVQR